MSSKPAPDHILRQAPAVRRRARKIPSHILAQMAAATRDAIIAGRVTKCPPAIAAGAYTSFSSDRIELS